MSRVDELLFELELEIRTLIFWMKLRYSSDEDFTLYVSKLAGNYYHGC